MELKKIMETCIPLKIKLRVEIETGENWGELSKYDISEQKELFEE
jgi:DNA polymerase I-like protein with 3'-5' exonuclease and polymerase domains